MKKQQGDSGRAKKKSKGLQLQYPFEGFMDDLATVYFKSKWAKNDIVTVADMKDGVRK